MFQKETNPIVANGTGIVLTNNPLTPQNISSPELIGKSYSFFMHQHFCRYNSKNIVKKSEYTGYTDAVERIAGKLCRHSLNEVCFFRRIIEKI